MPVTDALLNKLPRPLRELLRRHNELIKFMLVGGTTFIIDTAIFLGLKSTLLESKPLTAKVISTTVATVVSYILSRQWSFRTRGGRANHHEALLFFLISAIGVGVTVLPLGLSRYVLHLDTPNVSRVTQEIADFVSAQILGTLLAMVFRFWAFRRFVFPHANARPRDRGELEPEGGEVPAGRRLEEADLPDLDSVDLTAAELLGDPWPVPDNKRPETAGELLDSDTEDPLSTHS
ncbi:GtrA family protein [Rugosimonospora africana]|uniref:GtrA family protein n=1 Tax=Rugosimonospora africana TaxID=556532 RepID=UPI001EF1D7DB|nr:GtrA family protein [Rugosimonospora africana]